MQSKGVEKALILWYVIYGRSLIRENLAGIFMLTPFQDIFHILFKVSGLCAVIGDLLWVECIFTINIIKESWNLAS